MIEKLNKELELFTDKLTGRNYVCWCQLYEGYWKEGEDVASIIISSIVNGVVPRDLENSTMESLLTDVELGFIYPGGEGHYPNKKFFKSEEYNNLLREILDEISLLFENCNKIYKFQIIRGHPFYPIMWNYSYLAKCGERSLIIIGSSSD